MAEDTAETRLGAFCDAIEKDDLTLFPEVYVVEGHDPAPMIADLREVLAKLKRLN